MTERATTSPSRNSPLRVELFRCPATGEPLACAGGRLVSVPSGRTYEVTPNRIALFAAGVASKDARIQEAHYDGVAQRYVENLQYPHTQEYMAYFDRALRDLIAGPIDTVAELCCGAAEACWLFRDRVDYAVGIDMSTAMLARARARLPEDRFAFAQGDVCRLPLADGAFDAVFMLGGVHHVNDRAALFSEVRRILKPGGRFYFREPLNDFLPWRAARKIIYRLSAALDAETERPLRRSTTVRQLDQAGFRLTAWRSIGFVACCFLMNSDVLVFNRAFRFVPGIRLVTRLAARADDLALRLPGLRHAGIGVVGTAVKA